MKAPEGLGLGVGEALPERIAFQSVQQGSRAPARVAADQPAQLPDVAQAEPVAAACQQAGSRHPIVEPADQLQP